MLSSINLIDYITVDDPFKTQTKQQNNDVILVDQINLDGGNFNSTITRSDPLPSIAPSKHPLFESTRRPDPVFVQPTKLAPILDNTYYDNSGFQDKTIKRDLNPNIINNYFSTPQTIDKGLHDKVQNLNNSIAQQQFNINQTVNDIKTRQDKITDHIINSNQKLNTNLDTLNANILQHGINVKANQTNIEELQKQHTEQVNKVNIQNQTLMSKLNEVQQSNASTIRQTEDKITELKLQNENNIKKLESQIVLNRSAPVVKVVGGNDVFVPFQQPKNDLGLVLPVVIAFGMFALSQ